MVLLEIECAGTAKPSAEREKLNKEFERYDFERCAALASSSGVSAVADVLVR